MHEEIGRGAFATVFKAFDPSTKRVYAAKKLTYEHSSAELNILSKVSHVSLLRIGVGLVTDYGILGPYCVFRRCPG